MREIGGGRNGLGRLLSHLFCRRIRLQLVVISGGRTALAFSPASFAACPSSRATHTGWSWPSSGWTWSCTSSGGRREGSDGRATKPGPAVHLCDDDRFPCLVPRVLLYAHAPLGPVD